ncbi:hypothetical protein THTE_2132 [Thermogutta terrifontis]|uniref:Uncharacterized protein n=1 Tax=Thermogutta terrifontis TaxID=1331910 RepID=A0A286RFJ1_9BACT|nr:hypothetical protein THTE_2132 [Thermogutta terrifontis]
MEKASQGHRARLSRNPDLPFRSARKLSSTMKSTPLGANDSGLPASCNKIIPGRAGVQLL